MKAYTDYRKDLVSVRDRMGERLYQDDCQELIDDRQEIYDILAEKYEELNNELNSGGIEQGTEKWYEMKEELIGIKSEMINCANAVEDLSCCSAAQQVGCPVRTVTIFWSSRLLPMILRFPCRYLPGIPCLSLRQRLDSRRVFMEQQQRDDFTRGSIVAKLSGFMLPILGALILQAMYGAADILVVGRFGSTAGLSGVSTGSNIVNLVTFTVTGLSMGITVLIGRYIGEKRQEQVGRVIGGAICFFAVLSAAVSGVLLIFARQLALVMQAPAEAVELTVVYVQICGGGLLFIVAYNVISSIFRGMGNSRLPLIFVAIACGTNIVGDLLFVAVFHMNVAGAALATVLAQAVSVALSLIIIRRQKLPFEMKKRDICFNPEIGKFIKVGIPIAFQEILTQFSFLALCAFINRLGLEASSGYGVANKIVSFVMLVPGALMQSMSAFVAQNVGAGKEQRARRAMAAGMAMGAGIGVFISALAFFRGDLLAMMFTRDAAVVAKAAEYLRGFSIEAVVTSILFSFIGYYNGHSQTLFVMIQGIAQTFLVRLPMSYFMSIRPGAGLMEIGLAAPSATVFGIVLNAAFYIVYTKYKTSKKL